MDANRGSDSDQSPRKLARRTGHGRLLLEQRQRRETPGSRLTRCATTLHREAFVSASVELVLRARD